VRSSDIIGAVEIILFQCTARQNSPLAPPFRCMYTHFLAALGKQFYGKVIIAFLARITHAVEQDAVIRFLIDGQSGNSARRLCAETLQVKPRLYNSTIGVAGVTHGIGGTVQVALPQQRIEAHAMVFGRQRLARHLHDDLLLIAVEIAGTPDFLQV
jgi:hypothetical protein